MEIPKICLRFAQKKKTLSVQRFLFWKKPLHFQEAQTGFEPVNQGVADPRLTTWLLRRICLFIIMKKSFSVNWLKGFLQNDSKGI